MNKPIACYGVGFRKDRHAQNADFKTIFGLRPEQKWPDEGTGTVKVRTSNGEYMSLWVLPKTPKARQGVPRLIALCPRCSHTFGAGRIQQHYAVCGQ
jgi:hypothetical protein